MKKIGVIDCNIGNIYSLENALKKLKCNYKISRDPKIIEQFEKIILLGVGSFPTVMNKLYEFGFINLLKKHFEQRKYFLGICVGMQVLMTYGEEEIKTKGLDVVKGSVIPLKYKKGYPVPHVGWNDVMYDNNKKIHIFNEIQDKSSFYFVHSYHVKVEDTKIQMYLTQHGNNKFVSAIKKENIYGVQFHPEKSHKIGMKVLENFIKI